MNCKILDDEDIEAVETNKQKFRKWNIDQTEKRTFPFDRYEKKEFPFLFKKKYVQKEESSRISLDEIITKVKDLSMNSPVLASIQENVELPHLEGLPHLELDSGSNTPKYQPTPLTKDEINYVKKLDLDLKSNSIVVTDGKK
jgi:hypothetical protein